MSQWSPTGWLRMERSGWSQAMAHRGSSYLFFRRRPPMRSPWQRPRGNVHFGHEIRIEVLGAAYERAGEGWREAFADNAAPGDSGPGRIPGLRNRHRTRASHEADNHRVRRFPVRQRIQHQRGRRQHHLPRHRRSRTGPSPSPGESCFRGKTTEESRSCPQFRHPNPPRAPVPRARCGPPSDALGRRPQPDKAPDIPQPGPDVRHRSGA